MIFVRDDSKIALNYRKNRPLTFAEPNLTSTVNLIHAIRRYPTNIIAEIERNSERSAKDERKNVRLLLSPVVSVTTGGFDTRGANAKRIRHA